MKRRERLGHAISGAISGGLVSIAVQPLDVIRTRMQGDAAKGVIRHLMPTIKHIYKESGVLGFWIGTSPSIIRMAVGAGVHFSCLEVLRGMLPSSERSNLFRDAAIGGMARGVATVLLCPVTVIKTRMQYTGRPYRSVFHAIVTIARTEGMPGLFKGLAPTVVANSAFSGIFYMTYKRMQSFVCAENQEPTMITNLFCSTVAATAAAIITQPVDVVQTRVQLGFGTKGLLSSLATLRHVAMSQGARGVTLGVAPRTVKRVIQTGLVWTMYEEISANVRTLLGVT